MTASSKGPAERVPVRDAGAWLSDAGPSLRSTSAIECALCGQVGTGADRINDALAGHKTRSVFDRYNIVSEGDLRTAATQLAGLAGTIQGQSGTGTLSTGAEPSKHVGEIGGAARI